MPVMTDALLHNAGRLAAADSMSVANIIKGGQLGFGNHLSMMDASTPLVLRPLVGIVTHVPEMFKSPTLAAAQYPDTLKAIMERHVIAMDGVDVEYNIEDATAPAGQDGQEWHMPTNARRVAISPSARLYDVNGQLIWNFFTSWMKMIKDPDSQSSSLVGVVDSSTALDPLVWSMWTMDMLWLQYSTDLRPENLLDAYFTVGMWPHSAGPAGYTKEYGNSTLAMRNVQFHAVLQHNKNTRLIGQRVAETLGLHKLDYNFDVPIATGVESGVQDQGIAAEAAYDMANFTKVTP